MLKTTTHVTRIMNNEKVILPYHQITDIPYMQIGDEVVIERQSGEVESIETYASRIGMKLTFALNMYGDHMIKCEGWSFRKALMANITENEAGEIVIPILKPIQVSSMRAMACNEAGKHDKYIKVNKVALNQVKIVWGNKCDKPTKTWRSWTREILDALTYQESFDFNEYPNVTREMISSEVNKSDKLFTVRKGVVTRNKAKVMRYKDDFFLMYENKYNRVIPLPRMTDRRRIPMADQRLVISWLETNEPNFLDFLFGSNTIEYTQVEFKTPPPSLPRLEQ